jgi:hypothetical protein
MADQDTPRIIISGGTIETTFGTQPVETGTDFYRVEGYYGDPADGAYTILEMYSGRDKRVKLSIKQVRDIMSRIIDKKLQLFA